MRYMPILFLAETLAENFNNFSTTASLLNAMARCKGVEPILF